MLTAVHHFAFCEVIFNNINLVENVWFSVLVLLNHPSPPTKQNAAAKLTEKHFTNHFRLVKLSQILGKKKKSKKKWYKTIKKIYVISGQIVRKIYWKLCLEFCGVLKSLVVEEILFQKTKLLLSAASRKIVDTKVASLTRFS